jgi:hypothetical protein
VILGASSLKAYVTAPKYMHVLGIVRFGLEYGLLATDAEGGYYRVNGSRLAPLDKHSVGRAIEQAQRGAGRFALRPQPSDASAAPAAAMVAALAPPRVSIRKHRHIAESA